MDDKIDTAAIIDQLMHENEKLRERIAKQVLSPVLHIDIHYVRDWIIENYILIAACCLLISMLAGVFEVLDNARNRRKQAI